MLAQVGSGFARIECKFHARYVGVGVRSLSNCEGKTKSHECSLFDRNALRKIPRLIHVAASADGDVVGEELQRDDVDQR